MPLEEKDFEPDWDTPLELTVSPAALIHALFYTARQVHTGWESCIDAQFVTYEINAVDPHNDNHARFVEQEYVVDEDGTNWHDWTVELHLGRVFVIGHWQLPLDASPADWEWCTKEAESAFERACLFLGKRVRRGLAVEDPPPPGTGPETGPGGAPTPVRHH
ncbi:MAG: hypothetical protein ACPGUC_04860 [Gammaproteobacteria bacterium]